MPDKNGPKKTEIQWKINEFFKRDSEIPNFYANRFALVSSNWDFMLAFAHSSPLRDQPETSEILFTLNLSPVLAKQLARSLSSTVEGYEKNVAPIPSMDLLSDRIKGQSKAK